jgi:hypothetical protein
MSLSVDSFLETALWATHDYTKEETESHDEMLDATYSIYQVSDEFRAVCQTVLDDFYTKAIHLFTEDELNESPIEHDLWLTMHGHGAGFWDGDYEQGDALTTIANTMSDLEVDLINDLSNVLSEV